jgi:hypothetical protein
MVEAMEGMAMNRRERRRAEAQRRRTAMKRFYEDIDNDIRRDGRSVLCIRGEEDSLPFAYTIGNALKGLPELLMVGTSKGGLLNDLSQKMIDRGRGFDDGEIVSLGGKFPVKIITANDGRAQREFTIQAGQYLDRQDYVVQQVLVPDRSGRYPDDPQCQPPFSTFPVLRKPLD